MKSLSKFDRTQALLEMYKISREELWGFRSTIFQVYSILVTMIAVLIVASVQFNIKLLLAVPVPLALIFLASIAYSGWRWELVKVVANLEREIGSEILLPRNCRYEEMFVSRHKGGIPAGMERKSMLYALLITIASLTIFYLMAARMLLG
jgi:hypothetical protein